MERSDREEGKQAGHGGTRSSVMARRVLSGIAGLDWLESDRQYRIFWAFYSWFGSQGLFTFSHVLA